MANPCIYTLKDGTQLNYQEMRQYMLDNYSDIIGGMPPETLGMPSEDKGDRSNKGILTRLYESDNISDSAKAKFEKEGLKYEPKSKEESRTLAKGVVDTYGINEAVSLAEARRFGGGVNSGIFAEALDRVYSMEQSGQDKAAMQEKWADIAIRYDDWARGLGRDISQIDDFYKRSPIGVMIAEEKKREIRFKEWFDKNGKPYKEIFDELKNDPEFKKLFGEPKAESKAENMAKRMVRRQKIVDAFDKGKVSKGVAMATIIPPAVWNGAVEVMKQATLAGESVIAAIEKGIEYIKANHKETFDENKFKDYWENELKDISPEAFASDKLLEKYRDKMKKLTDSEKQDIIRKSIKKLIENGALDYEDFKQIIADTIGLGKMDDATKAKIEGWVNDINNVDTLKEKALKEKTKKAIQDYHDAVAKAENSANELANEIYNKPNIARTLAGIMQLNALTGVSLIKNVSYNFWWQLLGRFPKSAIISAMDLVIYGTQKLMGKNVAPGNLLYNVQKPFFSKLLNGFTIASKQIVTGVTNKDYFQKEIQSSQIKPFESLKSVIDWGKGKKRLSAKQITENLLKSTFGVPAEVVARLLNVGDKPYRFAAEGSQAEVEANRLGLKGIDKELFMSFPKEGAFAEFKKRGYDDEKAMAEAEVIEKIIIREGEEAVFQQENLINSALKKIGEGMTNFSEGNKVTEAANGLRRLIGTATMPFVKTPLNVGWHFYNLVNPEVAVTQSLVFGASAIYKFKKGDATWRMDAMQSKKWLAHAGVGIASLSLYTWMQQINAVSGGQQKEEKAKERASEKYYKQQHSINLNKVQRGLTGGDLENKEGDLLVDLSWFGAVGSLMNVQANQRQNMTPEQKEVGLDYWEDVSSRLNLASYEALEQGAFSGQAVMLQAIMDRNPKIFNQWALQLANMGMNVIQPGTFAQISRAELPYDYKISADNFSEQLKNSIASRSSLVRKLTDYYPPSAITPWGDIADRHDSPYLRVFGMSTLKKDNFAQPLYEDYEKSGNLNLFPSAVMPRISADNKDYDLGSKQFIEFQKEVGQERKKYVAPFVNNQAQMYVVIDGVLQPKYYNELKDDAQKVKCLQMLYKQGYAQGKINFMNMYPETFKQQETPDMLINEAMEKQANKFNKIMSKQGQ